MVLWNALLQTMDVVMIITVSSIQCDWYSHIEFTILLLLLLNQSFRKVIHNLLHESISVIVIFLTSFVVRIDVPHRQQNIFIDRNFDSICFGTMTVGSQLNRPSLTSCKECFPFCRPLNCSEYVNQWMKWTHQQVKEFRIEFYGFIYWWWIEWPFLWIWAKV